MWPKATIVVRAVEVKTKRGIFVGPVAKIALLEEN